MKRYNTTWMLALVLVGCGTAASTGPKQTSKKTDKTTEPAAARKRTAGDDQRVKINQTPESVDKVRIVNEPGMTVSMADVLVRGRVTVLEFYADWCGACKVIEKKLLTAIGDEPRIVLRKINIKDDTSDVAKQFSVGALPHVRIFDGNGKLAYVLVGNSASRAGKLAFDVLARK